MANPRYNLQVANKRVAKKDGGMMKPVDKNKNPGLAKLPKTVRNKMGYMKKGGMVDQRNKASKEIFKLSKGEKPRVKKSMGGILKRVSRDFKKMKPKSNSTGPKKTVRPELPNRVRTFRKEKAVGGMLKKVSRDFKKMKPLSKPSSPGPTRPAPEQLPNKPMRRFKTQKEK